MAAPALGRRESIFDYRRTGRWLCFCLDNDMEKSTGIGLRGLLLLGACKPFLSAHVAPNPADGVVTGEIGSDWTLGHFAVSTVGAAFHLSPGGRADSTPLA